jgi:leucyl aminopeptidase
MPLYPEYRRAMDSEVADIKNIGGRGASALTAAAFLGEFVDGASWAHMDIAGTARTPEASPFAPPGGTGAGVATIVSLALDVASPHHADSLVR